MGLEGFLPPVTAHLKAEVSEFKSKIGEARGELKTLATEGESTSKRLAAGFKQGATAIGGAMAGIGGVLTHLGEAHERAHVGLRASVDATGHTYEEFGGKIEDAVKHQEKFGHSAADTEEALSRLTVATQDPAKALGAMSAAADLAAFKHVSLTTASVQLGKALGGSNKALKELGIDTAALPPTLESANKALDKAKEHLQKVQDQIADGHLKGKKGAEELKKAQDDVATAQDGVAESGKRMDAIIKAVGERLHGQASAQANTFHGALKAIETKVEDVAAAFGAKWGPAITAVGTGLMGIGQLTGLASKVIGMFGSSEAAAGLEAEAGAAEAATAAIEGKAGAAETATAAQGGLAASAETNVAALGAEGAAAKTGAAGLGVMTTAMGVLAAAVAGAAIGTAIEKNFVAPVIKGIEDAHDISATNTEDMKNRFITAMAKMGNSSAQIMPVTRALNSMDAQGKLTAEGMQRVYEHAQLIGQAAAAGYATRDAIAAIAKGGSDSERAIAELQAKIDALHGKEIVVHTSFTEDRAPAGYTGPVDGQGRPMHYGGLVMHGGGTVPRLHEGLAPDERPAILQAGETVTRRSSVNSETASTLDHINRYGRLPDMGAGSWTVNMSEGAIQVIAQPGQDEKAIAIAVRDEFIRMRRRGNKF